ncbi:hypothetical protein [Planctomicrobium sp. SH527]|uniref:hypothetical protein n=1 Tax=Planctomicrobium sp. SH527 TaxID=3448123 RepID=UPI003F5C920D
MLQSWRQLLYRELCEWCLSWWKGDRIRISPQERLVWHLQPGSLLMIEGEQVSVLSRRLLETDPVGLEFTCRSADTESLLQVLSMPHFPYSRLIWHTTDGRRELELIDIQVWNVDMPPH